MEPGALTKKIFKTVDFHIFYRSILCKSVSVATRSRTWGYSHSFAGIAGSNFAGHGYFSPVSVIFYPVKISTSV
jgi:hypothetical protein